MANLLCRHLRHHRYPLAPGTTRVSRERPPVFVEPSGTDGAALAEGFGAWSSTASRAHGVDADDLAYYVWRFDWNTRTVPNGTYTVNSVAYDPAGNVGRSRNVTVTVRS